MNVENRKRIEREVIRAFVNQATAAGFLITVDNGEDCPVKMSRDVTAIMAGIMQTDEETLRLYHGTEDGHPTSQQIGWVYLVYGNDGWDVICNYTTNLEPLMTEADKVIEKYG